MKDGQFFIHEFDEGTEKEWRAACRVEGRGVSWDGEGGEWGVEVQGTIDVLGEPGLVLVYCVSEGVGIEDEEVAEVIEGSVIGTW